MRVAFDARHLQTVARHRGIGRYARNLLAAWQAAPPEGIAFTLVRLRNFPPPDAQLESVADGIRGFFAKR